MALKRFRVQLTNPEQHDDIPTLTADAAQYLAYADQTDTFGYRASIIKATIHRGRAVLLFEAPITSDVEMDTFIHELEQLSRTVSVEQVEAVAQ